MTPAEKRIKDQIDRWLVSLDLHLQYVDLNDLAYNRVQPWPVHDRPTRLILELAKQKTLELKALFESRLAQGDSKFAESLELMSFLANLIGSQHVQRFIPLADPEHATSASVPAPIAPIVTSVAAPAPTTAAPTKPAPVAPAPAVPTPVAAPTVVAKIAAPPPEPTITSATMAPTVIMPQKSTAPKRSADDDDATREMPKPLRAKPITPPPAAPVSAKPAPKQDTRKPASKAEPPDDLQLQIITDAVRLLNWGRPWHELAEAIARMADRPQAGELRRILRTHRAEIERRAAAEVATQKKK
jgi:hypothetical protein